MIAFDRVRYGTRAAFVDYDEAGQASVTADEILLPDKLGKPRKTGLLDQYGQPIYRVKERVPVGFETP